MRKIILYSLVMIVFAACNNDDCQDEAEAPIIEIEPRFCEVENPLQDLPWLVAVSDSIQEAISTSPNPPNPGESSTYIFSCELKNGRELIYLTNFMSGIFYTCSGDYYCSFYSGWSNDCFPRVSTEKIKERILLYQF